jgi:uncharacterized protein YfaS (alpha-2-macroglobulin family)
MGDAPRGDAALKLAVATPRQDEKRWLGARQHQRGIGLSGKAAGLGVVAVAYGHQPRLLQVAQGLPLLQLGIALKTMGDAPRGDAALKLAVATPRQEA